MKDDLLILNTLGKRHLPRLLPVILAAAAVVTALLIRNNGAVIKLFGRDHGMTLFVVLTAELICAVEMLKGPSAKQSRYRYTVGMLRISERRVFVDCCVFNVLVFLLIWASVCCAAVISGNALNGAGVYGQSVQGLYAESVLNGLMRMFVPMDDKRITAGMILFMVSLGIGTTCSSMARMRRKGSGLLPFWILIGFIRAALTDVFGGPMTPIMFWGGMLLTVVSLAAFIFTVSELKSGTNVEVDDGE